MVVMRQGSYGDDNLDDRDQMVVITTQPLSPKLKLPPYPFQQLHSLSTSTFCKKNDPGVPDVLKQQKVLPRALGGGSFL